MRKISSVIAALLAAAMLCSCSAESAEDTSADDVPEEETEAQTLTIDDPEYYTRFKGQNISELVNIEKIWYNKSYEIHK